MPFGRNARPPLGIDRLQSHQAHQSLHALMIDLVAGFSVQAGRHLWHAIKRRAQILLVDQAHQMQVERALWDRLVIVSCTVQTHEFALAANAQL